MTDDDNEIKPMTLLIDENQRISTVFPEEHFTIKHELCGHPLFSIERLLKLSGSLPQDQIEWNAGDAAVSQDPGRTPMNGLSPEETVASIETNKSWLVMKNIEDDPEYREVLHACLAEVEEIAGKRLTGLGDRAGFVFLSSPGSVTPYHMDPEHNFLLQLQGTKTMNVFDQRDRTVVSEQEIESTYYGKGRHRNLEFRQDLESKGEAVTLQPGDALHVPIHAPHWVKNGDEVSVSFSITFRSDQSRRDVRLHSLNARLRRFGMQPPNVGKRKIRDDALDMMFRGALSVKKAVQRPGVQTGSES